MRHLIYVIALVAVTVLALPAFAQESREARDEGDSPRRPIARERVLRAFDRDEDGRLNEEEIAAMREQLGERFNEIRERIRERRGDQENDADRDGARRREADGGRDRDRGPDSPESDRGPDARRGEEPRRDAERPREERDQRRIRLRLQTRPDGGPALGRRGPLGPIGGPPERDLQALFGWFDADGDNLLSRREFAELSQFVQRRRPGRLDGPAGPSRLGRRIDDDRMSPQEMMRMLRRGPRSERALERPRDEVRRRDDRTDRQPDRDEPSSPPRPADPPRPPRDNDRNPFDAV